MCDVIIEHPFTTNLKEDIDGLDGGHLEDVVGSCQNCFESELDDRTK